MLSQRLQQKLLQKLSPQQIELMKLLQIPTIALEQRIKEEMEDNPVLEEGEEEEIDDTTKEDEIDNEDTQEKNDENDEEFNLSDYMEEDETPTYKLNTNNSSADDEKKEMPFVSGITFQDLLLSQLGVHFLDDKQYLIASHIIGSINESGYLERDINAMVDDLAFSQNIETTAEEILSLLKVIQEFDPAGIGARNLQECLLIQLRRKDPAKTIDNAIMVVEKYFDAFSKKHYNDIIEKSAISKEDLKEAVDEILKLNPKPGNSLNEITRKTQYVIPDFTVINNDGELELMLNTKNIPELRLNKTYMDMLQAYSDNKDKSSKSQKTTLTFIKQKIESAVCFIDAIKQRQNTLYVTMSAIINYQKDYFLTGDETRLKPMILKDIAEIVKLDPSTISRVANSKYIQTPFGTFMLKHFFSEAAQTNSGEEVSVREIRQIMRDCIDAEDKKNPLTDEKLTEILKEKGYHVFRRTIAKYREQMGIPVRWLRKEL